MHWLSFSFVLIIINVQNNAEKFAVENCKARLNGGVCERDNLKVQVFKFSKSIRIDCKNGFYSQWILKLNLSDFNELKINECILPDNESYQMFGEHLGIKTIKILRIDSVENDKTFNEVNFHGFKDLSELIIYSSKHIQFAQHSFNNIKQLKRLTIHSSSMEYQSDFLQSLTEIQHLKLNSFGTKTIYECNSNLLIHKSNLKYLELKGFIMENVIQGCFSAMPKLENLLITNSLIEFKTFDPLEAFNNIRDFHLINNNIVRLSTNLLTSFKYLNTLIISRNLFANNSLPAGFLSNLYNLSVVEIVSNKFDYIPSDTFKDAIHITNLKLSGNYFTELPTELFQDLNKLRVLELVNNHHFQLHEDIFHKNYELQELDLSENNFQVFPKFIVNISHLKKLNLNKNMIKEIESIKSLRQLMQLEEFNLSHNNLNTFSKQWTSLSYLNLSNNNFTSLDLDLIQNISKVPITIDLRSNNIQVVNFYNFNIHKQHVKVTILLANNSMICDQRNLDFILFLNRKLNIDSIFNEMLSFEVGDLQCETPIMLHGKRIAELKSQEIVYELLNCTENCQCREKPATKTIIVTCTFLDNLKVITLPHLNGMKFYDLILDKNNLTSFPQFDDLIAFNSIRSLSIVDNQLTELPLLIPMQLEFIDFSNNMFDVINVEAMMNFQAKNTRILLKGNPLSCNCKSNEFLNYIQKYHDSIKDYDELRCHNNPTKFINNVTLDENCFLKSPWFYVILSSVLAVLTLGVAIYFRCQWDIKKWLHAHSIYNYPVLEEEINSNKEFDAFVMYSKFDEEFVEKQLMTNLEDIDNPWKLCIHVRDFELGAGIMTNIFDLIDKSRRAIIVMSPDFLESKWTRAEFFHATAKTLDDPFFKVIIIMLKPIVHVQDTVPGIKEFLMLHTYIEWNNGNDKFWKRVKKALPIKRALN